MNISNQKPDANKLNVLVIEDNQDHAEFIVDAIYAANPDHRVLLERDGESAVNELEHTRGELPDLILMDIKMPRLDGLSALRILKNTEKLRLIPVVIVTTSTTSLELDEAYRAGASGYIKKPIEIDVFQEKIKQMIHYWADIVELPGRLL
jgi:CheY-like chemotaxis protein